MNVARSMVLAFLVVFATGTPLLAQDHVAKSEIKTPTSGPGIGMGLAIIGIGIGIGLVGFAALSGIARQPEQAGAIQGAMILLAGLVEGAGIIALILCFVLGVS